MYAIVKTGGQQFKVANGDTLRVEKLDAAVGESVTLPVVMLVEDGVPKLGSDVSAALVTAEVVEHLKGPKIKIHKFKNKTRYHKRQGHRQPLTQLKIVDVAAA